MEHEYYLGKKNSSEVVKDKAWYFGNLIVLGVVEMYKAVVDKIKNDPSYGVRFLNEKRLRDAQIEEEVLFISLARMRAKEHLSEELANYFYNELVLKIAELESTSTETNKENFINKYKEHCSDRIFWHDTSNKQTLAQGVPSGDTHMMNCINLFGNSNKILINLFEIEFGKVYLNLNIDGLLADD